MLAEDRQSPSVWQRLQKHHISSVHWDTSTGHNADASKNRLERGVTDCLFPPIRSYTARTKAIIALAVISSVSLGVLVILTHFTSYVAHDSFINWLVRGGSVAMTLSCFCMLAILIITGTSKYEDVQGILGDLLIQNLFGKRHNVSPIPDHWSLLFIQMSSRLEVIRRMWQACIKRESMLLKLVGHLAWKSSH